MKPLLSRTEDGDTLRDLGRASIQIVHDLKNQLNGLKLYATFLRKRLEKSDRPDDEQETVGKLISGLERAANDLSTIVQYGRPIELKKQPGLDVQKVLRSICSSLTETNCAISFSSEPEPLTGEFDPTMLADALKWISVGATKLQQDKTAHRQISVTIKRSTKETAAIVEWSGLNDLDHDPFRSFIGSDEIRMSLAARIVEAHGGSTEQKNNRLVVNLPLSE
jgi:nitrogen fixation/metabolism regulation signal transduction histidine kinase